MATEQSSSRQWVKFLRPLLWWGIVLLALLGYHEHKKMMERTRVNFSFVLSGQKFMGDGVAKLDGQPVINGGRISLGKHVLTITHPKVEPFKTNFFGWYGGRDFGQINLKRAMGALNMTSQPAAQALTINGPEFFLTLNDTTGTNLLVPTDNYHIRAQYARTSETRDCQVTPDSPTLCNFTPQLGALSLTCNLAEATFQVRDAKDKNVETGDLPATVSGLPVGNYQVVATHHETHLTRSIVVKANATQSLSLEFQYGAVIFATTPMGVTVTDENRQRLGQTPLTLNETLPGKRVFTLQKNGYQSVEIGLDVEASQTNLVSTNLISDVYLTAMKLARQHMAATNYDRALAAVKQALAASPDDAAALALQREGSGLRAIQMAKSEGARGNYIGGIKFLETALQLLPDNEEAKGLLADFKKRAPEQTEREQADRLNRIQTEFDSWMTAETHSSLFDTHELKTTKPFKEVQEAIRKALTSEQPALKITRDETPKTEVGAFEVEQEFMTYMNTSAGKRRCVIFVGQTKDDETKILFKVFEYKTEAVEKFSIGNLIGTPVAVNYVPIHASRMTMTAALTARLAEGVQLVNDRIQQAIGQP